MILFYIMAAIFITLLLNIIRTDKEYIDNNPIFTVVSWSIIIFGIILGFTISGFYSRLIDIQNNLITEITNLQLIYRMLYTSPHSEKPRAAILNYVTIFLDEIPSLRQGINSLKRQLAYREMDYAIIQYVNDYPSTLSSNILSRMSTDELLKELINEINGNVYYIYFILFLFILLLIQLCFVKTKKPNIQFIIEFSFVSIILSAIYLLTLLNDPFDENSIIGVNINIYQDLYDEIKNNY